MTSIAKPVITNYKQFYTSPWGIAFIAYFLAMGLVGAFTPADILKANPWAREFCDFMANIVPQIDAVTKLNIAPDINRFYFSVMWAGSPLLMAWTFCLIWFTRNPYLADKSTAWRLPFLKLVQKTLLGALIFVFVMYCFDFATDNKSRVLLGMFKYPLGRATSLPAFVFAPIFMLSIIAFAILGWLTGYIPRNIKYQNELEQKNG